VQPVKRLLLSGLRADPPLTIEKDTLKLSSASFKEYLCDV